MLKRREKMEVKKSETKNLSRDGTAEKFRSWRILRRPRPNKKQLNLNLKRTRWLSNIDYNTSLYIYIYIYINFWVLMIPKCVVIRKFQLCWQLVNSVSRPGRFDYQLFGVSPDSELSVRRRNKFFWCKSCSVFFFFFSWEVLHVTTRMFFFKKSQPTSLKMIELLFWRSEVLICLDMYGCVFF